MSAGQETGHRSGTLKQEPHESACGMGGHIGEIACERKARASELGWFPQRFQSAEQPREECADVAFNQRGTADVRLPG